MLATQAMIYLRLSLLRISIMATSIAVALLRRLLVLFLKLLRVWDYPNSADFGS